MEWASQLCVSDGLFRSKGLEEILVDRYGFKWVWNFLFGT